MHVKHSPPLPKRNKKHTHRVLTESPSLEEILLDICNCFGQSVEMIKSESQFNKHIVPRRIYCYVSHVLTNVSCGNAAALINRDHTTYLDRIQQCLDWFELNETNFMDDWRIYILKSKVWRKYFLIKKQATIGESSEYMQRVITEANDWKRLIKQAKEQKRKWSRRLEKALKEKNYFNAEVAKANVDKYSIKLTESEKGISSLKFYNYKAA